MKNKDTSVLKLMSVHKFYYKFIVPYVKYRDIVDMPFIGKNILIVAKVTK